MEVDSRPSCFGACRQHWQSFKKVATLSSSIVITAIARESADLVTFVFVGQTGGAEFIGAATLGNMMCNLTGFSLAFGLCSALDTLISQAYGAKAYSLTGLYAQRAAVILTLSSIPVALLWSQTEFFLHYLLGIPPSTSAMAGIWARILISGLWPSLMSAILTKWLQGQNIVWPVVVASALATLFNVASNLTLIHVYKLGFEAPAYTVVLMNWFSFLLLCVIIVARKYYIRHYYRGPIGHYFLRRRSLQSVSRVFRKRTPPTAKPEKIASYSSLPTEALDTSTYSPLAVVSGGGTRATSSRDIATITDAATAPTATATVGDMEIETTETDEPKKNCREAVTPTTSNKNNQPPPKSPKSITRAISGTTGTAVNGDDGGDDDGGDDVVVVTISTTTREKGGDKWPSVLSNDGKRLGLVASAVAASVEGEAGVDDKNTIEDDITGGGDSHTVVQKYGTSSPSSASSRSGSDINTHTSIAATPTTAAPTTSAATEARLQEEEGNKSSSVSALVENDFDDFGEIELIMGGLSPSSRGGLGGEEDNWGAALSDNGSIGIVEEEEEDPEDNWPSFSIAVFQDWGTFLRLGIPGALSLFMEWGSFELAASIAAKLGPVALAVHGIFMSTANVFYMTPQAIALATATVTGNALGAEQPEEAAEVVRVGICIDFIYGILAGSLLLFVLRPYWGSVFSTDDSVKDLVYSTMPVMFIYLVVDSTKCVTLTLLRSTGRPQITVWGNIFACLLVMLPVGWLTAIHFGYGLNGLWLSMSLAWFISTVVYFIVLVTTDWRTQVLIKGHDEHEEKKDTTTKKKEFRNSDVKTIETAMEDKEKGPNFTILPDSDDDDDNSLHNQRGDDGTKIDDDIETGRTNN